MFVSNDGILQQSKMIEDENGEMIEKINDVATLTLNGILNTKKIVTEELETNVLTINDNVTIEDEDGEDVNAASAGSSTIVAGETVTLIKTVAINAGSKVFTTVRDKNAIETTLTVTEVEDGYCEVSIPTALANDLTFDWFVIN